MTTQIIVMNLNGVAVASDTAVSKSAHGGPRPVGFESKMVRLPEPHKLVVMHSGLVTVNGVPHLTQIQAWANSLTKPLPTVRAYVDHYIRWSGTEKRVIATDSAGYAINPIVGRFFTDFKQAVQNIDSSIRETTNLEPAARKRERNKRITAKVKEIRSFYAGLENYKGLTRAAVEAANKKFIKGHAEFFDELFENDPLTPTHKKAMLELTNDALLKAEWTSSLSFIDFVGFGATEPFARTIRLSTQGVYANKLACMVRERKPLDSKAKSPKTDVIFIAQDDAMQTFWSGYHPDAAFMVTQSVLEHLGDKINEPAVEGPVSEAVRHAVEKGLDKMADNQVQPMWDSLRLRPVSDLAEFAESMLKIQTLSSRLRGDATAGGTIEVSTLQK